MSMNWVRSFLQCMTSDGYKLKITFHYSTLHPIAMLLSGRQDETERWDVFRIIDRHSEKNCQIHVSQQNMAYNFMRFIEELGMCAEKRIASQISEQILVTNYEKF